MRILWFSVTPSLFNPHSNGHNGGGWVASLEQIVRKNKEIKLGVAFDFPDNGFKYEKDGISYYPIPTRKRSLVDKLSGQSDVKNKVAKYLQIIEDTLGDKE